MASTPRANANPLSPASATARKRKWKMCIDRRELLRQFGIAAVASAFLPRLAQATAASADAVTHYVRLDRNENAYGPGEKATEAFRAALKGGDRYRAEQEEKI